MRKTFKTCDNKGFQITFPNGVTLSTQFGWGNYCENYDKPNQFGDDVFKIQRENGCESNNAEIAIFTSSGRWITDEWRDKGDNVIGHVYVDEWLSAFDFCRKYKSKTLRQRGVNKL